MAHDLNTYVRLVGETLRDPSSIARSVVGLRLPHETGWTALASVTLLSLVLVYAESIMPGRSAAGAGFGGQPFIDALFLGSITVILVFLIYYGGRAIGGTGTFGATLLIMAWFQAVVLALIVLQLLATFLVPAFGGIFAMIVVGLEIYCLVHFLNVLHQFKSLWKAGGLIVLSICGLAVGLSVILLMIGGASTVGAM